jgi:thiol-disulfide isomerase/thioredoxin
MTLRRWLCRLRGPRPAAPAGVSTVALAVVLGTVLAGCSSAPSQRAGTSFVAGDGVITMVAPAHRQDPVAVSGETLEGTRLDLATLRGKPVVLNVWGSWCAPCRTEAPVLEAAKRRLTPDRASFVGIDTRDDDAAQALAFQRRYQISYPSLVDDGALLLALRGAVPPSSIPSTLVLDGQGRIAARISGPVPSVTTLVDVVADVAGGRS